MPVWNGAFSSLMRTIGLLCYELFILSLYILGMKKFMYV